MQEIIQSLYLVIDGNAFFINMGIIISVGMFSGVKLNDSLAGFNRSLVIIFPYSALLFLTNLSRIAVLTDKTPNAYNSTWTILLTTFAYVVGLYIGHVIFCRAKKEVQEEKNDDQQSHLSIQA